MTIYSGFTHWKWWFSIATLNYQRVSPLNNNPGNRSLVPPSHVWCDFPDFPSLKLCSHQLGAWSTPKNTLKRSIVSRSVFTCMHHNASIAPSSPNHQPKAGWLLQKPWGQPVRECQRASSQVGMETIDPPSDSGLPHGYFWCLHFCHLSIYRSIYGNRQNYGKKKRST